MDRSSAKTSSNIDSAARRRKKRTPRKNNKQSPKLRPRRRASQTYFFKYQLARNPLKAEEEDLKLALLASLQQSNSAPVKKTKSSSTNSTSTSSTSTSSTASSSSSSSTTSSTSSTSSLASSTATVTLSNTSNFKPPPGNHKEVDEELEKYKPDTQDFLAFICFRTTAPNFQNVQSSTTPTTATTTPINNNVQPTSNGWDDTANTPTPTPTKNATNSINLNGIARRPTRQSPRLASSHKKISENESLNHTYEEDMKKASLALEDMAHEINSSDGIKKESKVSSPYKNNKHLVKGLMTREFAGAFADEETIFESISNHKL